MLQRKLKWKQQSFACAFFSGYLSLIIVICLSLQKIQLIRFIFACYKCFFLCFEKSRGKFYVKIWALKWKRKKQERLKEKYIKEKLHWATQLKPQLLN